MKKPVSLDNFNEERCLWLYRLPAPGESLSNWLYWKWEFARLKACILWLIVWRPIKRICCVVRYEYVMLRYFKFSVATLHRFHRDWKWENYQLVRRNA